MGREGDDETTDPSVPSGAGHAQGNIVRGSGCDGDAERITAAPALLRASSSSSYIVSETSDSGTPLLKEDRAPSKVGCVVVDVWRISVIEAEKNELREPIA